MLLCAAEGDRGPDEARNLQEEPMTDNRWRLIALVVLTILALSIAGCTRSASTPPPSTEETEGTGGAESETQATMDAVRSAILTQTAQAGGGDAAATSLAATFTPTPGIEGTAPALLATATETPCAEVIDYVVKPGDWIWQIARTFGVDPQAIIELNELSNPGTIYPGLELKIPVDDACVTEPTAAPTSDGTSTPSIAATPEGEVTIHVVKPGEWLWEIARQYGVDPQAIIDANNLSDPGALEVGQELIIP